LLKLSFVVKLLNDVCASYKFPANVDLREGRPLGVLFCRFPNFWVFKDIKFDFDKATLRPESKPILDGIYEALRDNPELKVEIQGHTCWIGTDAYNMGLSQRRANTVMKYLNAKGIAASRMTAKGFGESQPIDTNKTKEGRANNRRVELKPMQ
jgi:OOP family OmpA-OmpF porin